MDEFTMVNRSGIEGGWVLWTATVRLRTGVRGQLYLSCVALTCSWSATE
jgi:hypothetical protein